MKYLKTFVQVLLLFVLCSCQSTPKKINERNFEIKDMFGNRASISFKPDGTVNGFAGVNRFFGKYKINGNNIRFEQMGATKMAGSPAAMRFEDKFLQALAKADRCTLIGNTFTLYEGEKPLITLSVVE